MRTIEQMVQMEVLCCMSGLVSTLAQGSDYIGINAATSAQELRDLSEQAIDLAGLDREHHAVSEWLADHLIAHGEKVDKDFANLCVWARTTTGQAISNDGVIEAIYAETHKPE